MNNITSIDGQFSQMSLPVKSAIYVSPNISDNYGYMLPMPSRTLNSNTYTFIYKENPNCKIFIAPISLRKHFSKVFLSYNKYNRKLEKYLKSKCPTINTTVPKGQILERKPHVYEQLDGLTKIMEIFDITHSDEQCTSNTDLEDGAFVTGFCDIYGEQQYPHNIFTPPELYSSYFFWSLPEDYAFDD